MLSKKINDKANGMLVHICCSVDSHYFLQRLREDFPDEKLIGFFYNPNVHPRSEHDLRLDDVRRSCDKLGVPLIEGEYQYERWYSEAKTEAEAPEKGARCAICFDERLLESAREAVRIGESFFTTTLLTSPKKSLRQLAGEGERIGLDFGLEFVGADYRKGGGTQQQFQMVKEEGLYKQSYCGCFFALNQQKPSSASRQSFLSRQLNPDSPERRRQIYAEAQKRGESVIKSHQLCYEITQGWLKRDGETIPSHILPYSLSRLHRIRGEVMLERNGIHYLDKGGVKLLMLSHYNVLMRTAYTSVKELMWSAPAFEMEVALRQRLLTPYDFSPLIVLDDIEKDRRYELFLEASLYEEMGEDLISFC